MSTESGSVVCPGPLVDGVGRAVRTLRERAPGTEAKRWTPEEREEALSRLDGFMTELSLYRGQVLVAHKESGQWGSTGDRDFTDWRSRTTGSGRGAAMGEVKLAEGLAELPAVAEAVDNGELGLEQAKVFTRLQEHGSEEVKQALADGGLDQLMTQAKRDRLTAPELGKAAKAWAAGIDAAAAQKDFEAVRRRRSLTMRNHAGGVSGEFFLDPVAGEEVRAALEAVAGRPGAGDDRTREQRMADALCTMAGRALQVGSDLTGAQVRPHLALLVPWETWIAISARRRRFASCPDGPRRLPWPDVPAAELEDGTAMAPSELERLMCDCETTRMVIDATGIPLDVGRTQRTYTKELRRAVVTRDRHCQWPQCRQRASWCEVHHIVYYSRGGATSRDNAITLCSFHHHRVHEHDIRITLLPNGFDFHYASGGHIGTTKRGEPPGRRYPDPECPTDTAPTGADVTLLPPSPPAKGTSPPGPAAGTGQPRSSPGTGPPGQAADRRQPPPGTGPPGQAADQRPPPRPPRPSSDTTTPTLWDPDPPS